MLKTKCVLIKSHSILFVNHEFFQTYLKWKQLAQRAHKLGDWKTSILNEKTKSLENSLINDFPSIFLNFKAFISNKCDNDMH